MSAGVRVTWWYIGDLGSRPEQSSPAHRRSIAARSRPDAPDHRPCPVTRRHRSPATRPPPTPRSAATGPRSRGTPAATDTWLFMQDQVLRCGDLPVAAIARDVGVSHQTIYKALTGPRLPSRAVAQDLATYLGRTDSQQLVEQVLERWTLAVAEEREPKRTPTSTHSRGRPWGPIDANSRLSMTRFVEELRRVTTRAGITQHLLATQTGTSPATLSRYFRGSSLPSDAILEKLVDALGASPAERAQLEADLHTARTERYR
jgi:transcriptional regulator with XRE-family HTH domain